MVASLVQVVRPLVVQMVAMVRRPIPLAARDRVPPHENLAKQTATYTLPAEAIILL